METIEAFNHAIFLILNASPNSPHWFVEAGVLIATYAIWLVPAILISMWLSGKYDQRQTALLTVFVGIVALGINQLIGLAGSIRLFVGEAVEQLYPRACVNRSPNMMAN